MCDSRKTMRIALGCIRLVDWKAARVILICSFAVWRSLVDLFPVVLSAFQIAGRYWRYYGPVIEVGNEYTPSSTPFCPFFMKSYCDVVVWEF